MTKRQECGLIVAAALLMFVATPVAHADEERGACCLPAGTCVEVTEELCESIGGMFQGELTECATVTCPVICVGDIIPDGEVCVLDLIAVLVLWGECHPHGCIADLNRDGVVDVLDLLEVLGAWGPCPP